MKTERRGRFSDETRAELNTNFTRGTTLATFHATDREKTDRQKERNLRAWRRKLSGVLLIIILICGLGILALTQFSGSFVSINSNVPTIKASDADRYKNIVDEYLSSNPFERFSFARRNDNLLNFVAEQAPEVKDAKVSQAGMLLGKLQLEFREPVAMWKVANKTSYVDAEGVVFSQNYFATPQVAITDNSGAAVNGDAVASSRFLGFIGQVTAELEKNNNAVERVVIPTGAIRYVEFYLNGRKYPFKAQIDRDATRQATDILAMVKYLDAKKIIPAYVDCRVAGKGYWK
jgi:cell division septal protein FtsQ